MNQQTQRALLLDFFGGYFHEDWPCEAESPQAVVAGYMRSATTHDILSLSQAIRDYSRNFASDGELEDRLFNDLGCYYRPSEQGMSARAWCNAIADQLSRKRQS